MTKTTRTLMLAAAAAILTTGFSVSNSTPGYSMVVNQDSTRQRCEFYRTKALFGNQLARSGEISKSASAARWYRYRDCVGSKDYLVPLKYRHKR